MKWRALIVVLGIIFFLSLLPLIWAAWTDSLDVDLKVYWGMDSSLGNETNIANRSILNLSTFVGPVTRGLPGLIGNSYNFVGGSYVETTNGETLNSLNNTNGTISLWINWTGSAKESRNTILGFYNLSPSGGGNTMEIELDLDDRAGQKLIVFRFVTTVPTPASGFWNLKTGAILDATFPEDEWVHLVIRHNGTEPGLYINGVPEPIIFEGDDNTTWWDDMVNEPDGGPEVITLGMVRVGGIAIRGFDGEIDEVGLWTRPLSDSEITDLYNAGAGMTPRTGRFVNVSAEFPTEGLVTTNTTINFNVTMSPTNLSNVKVTLFLYDSSNNLLNNSFNIVTGDTLNETIFTVHDLPVGTLTWNAFGCGSTMGGISNCNFSLTNITFTIADFLETQTFNSSVYETEAQNAILDVVFNDTEFTSASALFFFNSIEHSSTISGTSPDFTFTTDEFDIPLGAGTKEAYWSVSLTNSSGAVITNSTFSNITVGDTNLSLCGLEGGTVPFFNFTFKDETTNLDLNVSNDLTDVDYWLGSGSTTKSYVTSNTTVNTEYAYCLIPPDRTATVDLTFKYSAAGYPLRTFQLNSQLVTNSSTDQVLYLLATADGIYSSIQTTEVTGTPITGVSMSIERQFAGIWTIVGQGVGGSDGIITFWVNPNFNHRITATKTGYVTSQVTITPSQSLYTLIMSKTTGDAEFSGTTEGMSWSTYPPSGYLAPGTYNFAFNLTANLENLDGSYCKLEIVNSSDSIVATVSGGNASACNIGVDYTHLDGERIFGKLYIDTTNTTGFVLIDADQRWTDIEGTDVAPWRTIFGFFTELKDLDEWGVGSHRQEWNRTVTFFLLLTISIGVFSFFTQWDSQYPGAAILMIFIIIMFASFSGWFVFDMQTLENQGYAKFEKYFLAFITFSISLAWYIGHVRRVT